MRLKLHLIILVATILSTLVVGYIVLHAAGFITFANDVPSTELPPLPPSPRGSVLSSDPTDTPSGPGVRAKALAAERLRPLDGGYLHADAGGSGYFRGQLGSAAEGKRLAFVHARGGMHAVDVSTGAALWTSSISSISFATVSSGALLVTSRHTDSKLFVLEAVSGRTLWKVDDFFDGTTDVDQFPTAPAGPAVVSKGKVYLLSGRGLPYEPILSPHLHGFLLSTGERILNAALDQRERADGMWRKVGVQLNVDDDFAYVGNRMLLGDQPLLQAFELSTGDRRWGTASMGGAGHRVLVLSGLVVVLESSGYLRALDRGVGVELWSASMHATKRGSGCFGSPALAGERIIVSTSEGLVAFEGTTGRRLWSSEAGPGESFGPPVVSSGKIFVASDAGVEAVSSDSGESLWRRELEAVEPYGVAVAGEDVFVQTRSSLECLSAETGETRWRYQPDDGMYSIFSPVVAD
jgi:outer membrane protein assembly factor BamB